MLAHNRIMIGLWDCDQQGYSEFQGLANGKNARFTMVSNINSRTRDRRYALIAKKYI
jgi:hypothetical protein